jgi:hypothetical protein
MLLEMDLNSLLEFQELPGERNKCELVKHVCDGMPILRGSR